MLTATFVINLHHRADRRNEMIRQLDSVGWSATFFSAVKPDDLAGFPSVGARGCFLSHLAVLREGRRLNVDTLIILEDDVDFASNFRNEWPLFLRHLNSKCWSIAYPAHYLEAKSERIEQLFHFEKVRCAHFMMINGRALDRIIFELEAILEREPGDPRGGPMHIDGAYAHLREQNKELQTFAAFPSLAFQRSSKSDIAEPKWFDRISAASRVVAFARKIKQRF